MSTVGYREMKELAEGFERIFHSAVCSGIVGDARHARAGGYHIGRAYQAGSNYSVVRPDDRSGQGPSDGASAIDMSMNAADMRLATARLAGAYRNTADPRRKYLNAFNGWDGTGTATRFDVYARRTKPATSDHKWHIHLEQRRRYICDRTSNLAILSILRGESVATWLRNSGITAAPITRPGRTTALKAPAYPGRVLRRNDRQREPDAAVRQWQQRMRARGWTSIGNADGLPGKKFETVVKAWQKTCRLPVDGTVGPHTWPTPWTRPMGS
jgi:hypothetical protein